MFKFCTTQQIGQKIVEDVMETWDSTLTGLFIAMISCLILIAIMRWIARPLVWLSILGVIAILGYGKQSYTHISQFNPKTKPKPKFLIYRNLLRIQTLALLTRFATRRCQHTNKFEQNSGYMVTKAKHLAVWWHCNSSAVGNHIVSGSCAPKTNRYRHCACERGQQVSTEMGNPSFPGKPMIRITNKLLFMCLQSG